MTPEQLEQIARVYKRRGYEHFPTVIDREVFQAGYRAGLEAAKAKWDEIDGHATDDTYLRIEFEDWLDDKLKETGV